MAITVFPSLRLRAMGFALFRRSCAAAALGIVFLAAFFAVLAPFSFSS